MFKLAYLPGYILGGLILVVGTYLGVRGELKRRERESRDSTSDMNDARSE